MKILMANTHFGSGGASIAAYRLHKGLNEIGVESFFFNQVQNNLSKKVLGPSGRFGKVVGALRPYVDNIPLLLYPSRRQEMFSNGWIGSRYIDNYLEERDLLHLHWISDGFVSIKNILQIKKPIVWTLHDMWAFTGGCHYSGDCKGYLTNCGNCRLLNSRLNYDLSKINLKKKKKIFSKVDISIVTPSAWLAGEVIQSEIIDESKVHVIPNGIDTKAFFPVEKKIAKKILNIDAEKKVILFGAENSTADKRKGFGYLQEALNLLAPSTKGKVVALVFGKEVAECGIGVELVHIGQLKDDISMRVVYSSADMFVAPSIQDNLPNTVVESLACGTPCVVFDVGGMKDMIDDKVNGRLISKIDARSLAEGINWLINIDDSEYAILSNNARNKVLRDYEISKVAQQYKRLYETVI